VRSAVQVDADTCYDQAEDADWTKSKKYSRQKQGRRGMVQALKVIQTCHVLNIVRDQSIKQPNVLWYSLSDCALGTKAPAESPPVEPLTCEQWAPCSCGHFEPLDDSGCGMCSSCGAAIESQLPAAVQAWVQASKLLF
jgi:hypothetical protein